MNELTLDAARRKYDFTSLHREDYARVREVEPDAQGQGALFAYAPPEGDHVAVDMYATQAGRATPVVTALSCHVGNADKVVEAIVAGDLSDLTARTDPA